MKNLYRDFPDYGHAVKIKFTLYKKRITDYLSTIGIMVV